jgi:LysM repeat protein
MRYIVKAGESLNSIAQRCGVSFTDILNLNPAIKKNRMIVVGQAISIPSADDSKRPSCGGGGRPTIGGKPHVGGLPAWALATARSPAKSVPIKAPQKSGPQPYNTWIRIKGSASFVRRVQSELDAVAKTSTGTKLVGSAADAQAWRSKFQVTISKGKTCRAEPMHVLNGWKKGSYIMYDHFGLPNKSGNKGKGTGCGTKLEYNPDQALPSDPWFKNMPTALLLAHELIHAYLYARGEADPTKVDDIRNHERQVVGLAPFQAGEITENKLRAQWKPVQPKRTQYKRRR